MFNFRNSEKDIYSINGLTNYKFTNPLIKSKNIKLNNLQRIFDECQVYSIAANYFILYLLFQVNEHFEKLNKYQKILESKLKQSILFYNDIIKTNITNILIYEKEENNDWWIQIDEWSQLFNLILLNIKDPKEVTNYKKEDPNVKLKVKQ